MRYALNFGSHRPIWIRISEFLKDSSALQGRAFFYNVAHISGNLIGSAWRPYHRCTFGQGFPR